MEEHHHQDPQVDPVEELVLPSQRLVLALQLQRQNPLLRVLPAEVRDEQRLHVVQYLVQLVRFLCIINYPHPTWYISRIV